MTRFNKLRAFVAVAAMSAATGAFAADIDMNADANDVAISGYDPVAYFSDSEATKGSAEYTATYKNAIYHFSSAENRDLFRADPGAYAPQYGGYCAFGVTMEKKFDVDPEAWKIVDNKLYLNCQQVASLEIFLLWLQNILLLDLPLLPLNFRF